MYTSSSSVERTVLNMVSMKRSAVLPSKSGFGTGGHGLLEDLESGIKRGQRRKECKAFSRRKNITKPNEKNSAISQNTFTYQCYRRLKDLIFLTTWSLHRYCHHAMFLRNPQKLEHCLRSLSIESGYITTQK